MFIRVYSLLLLLFLPLSAQPDWLAQSIRSALDQRDAYYHQVGVNLDGVHNCSLLSVAGADNLKQNLSENRSPDNPWYCFLSALSESGTAPGQQVDNWFSEALRLTSTDAGQTWVLFMESYYAGQNTWAASSLKQLERETLVQGAQGGISVSLQLAMLAAAERKQGDPKHFLQMLDEWSAKFENGGFAYHMRNAAAALPSNFPVAIPEISAAVSEVGSSWVLQAQSAWILWKWLKTMLMLFVIGAFAGVAAVAFPTACHRPSYIFQRAIPIRLRVIFFGTLVLSIGFVSPVLMALAMFVMMWPVISSGRRIILGIAAAIVALSPVVARVDSMFNAMIGSEASAMIYQRAIDEGFTSALRDSAAVRYQRSCREPLLAAAAAVLSAKNHDDAAADYAQAALRLSPADPVLLTVAGSAAFLSGNPKSARFRFESAVKSMPNYQPALFDLGQVNIMYASTSTGEENIVSATNADAAVTSAFAGKNAEYFADSWPRNRLLIPAELPVSYFWQQYAFREGGWNDDGGEWNHLMPGVPPKPALFFLLLCFGLVIGIAAYNARRRQVQTVFYCSICGTAMCKKCRTGSLCASCISAVESANTEPGQQEVKIAIRVRQRRLFHVVSGLLDLLFPGSGGLYRKPSPDIGSIIALIATSMLYSVLITVWSIPSVNTSESMNPIYLLISIPVIIYWLVSAAFAAGRIANAANARFV